MSRQTFIIEVVDAGDEIPVAVRLRRVLKALLRSYSFRCRSITTAEIAGSETPQTTPGPLKESTDE